MSVCNTSRASGPLGGKSHSAARERRERRRRERHAGRRGRRVVPSGHQPSPHRRRRRIRRIYSTIRVSDNLSGFFSKFQLVKCVETVDTLTSEAQVAGTGQVCTT